MNIAQASQDRAWLADWAELSPRATPLWSLPDLAARLGGEEFAVLMPQTGLEEATRTAERIAGRLREHVFEAEGRHFHVTQSVGVAQSAPRAAGGCEEVLRLADANLYRAKREGRDCVIASPAAA